MSEADRFRRPSPPNGPQTLAGSAHPGTAESESAAPPHSPSRFAHHANTVSDRAAQLGQASHSPRYAPPLTQPARYIPSVSGSLRYAPPPLQSDASIEQPGRDAPLIHPAVARVSSNMAYGVPVYYAPHSGKPPTADRSLSITGFVLGLSSLVLGLLFSVLPVLGLAFSFIGLKREPEGRVFAGFGLASSALALLGVLALYVFPFVLFLIGLASGEFD